MRELLAEFFGTFILIVFGVGVVAQVVLSKHTAGDTLSINIAWGLAVTMGCYVSAGVSGAHLNPAVSLGFALRRDFPWRRVPGYILAQLVGAALAALFLQAVVDVSATYGANAPADGYSSSAAFWMELVLTLGLVSVILGTASGAQNIGIIGAFGVGGYIALAGLWGSPISGASMNPARSFGPALVGADFTSYWVYVAGPLAGALVAVACAYALRGRGGGKSGSSAAQGELGTEVSEPNKP